MIFDKTEYRFRYFSNHLWSIPVESSNLCEFYVKRFEGYGFYFVESNRVSLKFEKRIIKEVFNI